MLIVACVDYTHDVGECLGIGGASSPGATRGAALPAGQNGLVNEAFGAGVDDIVALPNNGSAEIGRCDVAAGRVHG